MRGTRKSCSESATTVSVFTVVDNLEELRGRIRDRLYRRVAGTADCSPVEELDI
ncbi:hypothetical protein [Nocardia grenadensis]|uniref:hypothetical protein n=1 Tax=Nocardia grenadensis TaxID=931537 RepID=UPI003D7560A8